MTLMEMSYMYVYMLYLCAFCRSTALWPFSRFLAFAQHSPFPLVPWERLPLPLLRKSQRPDCSLRDLRLWPVPQYRWVNAHEATGLYSRSAHIPDFSLQKSLFAQQKKTFTQWPGITLVLRCVSNRTSKVFVYDLWPLLYSKNPWIMKKKIIIQLPSNIWSKIHC